ncbi:starvation-inducible DNA-binding protein [Vibrio cholerae]|nr:starvation-inducible DNA-binding protein [Vibrio cholerae]
MQGLVDGFSILLHQQRDILELAGETGDEGTSALMSDYIREQEKLVWMLNAWLK